MRTVVMKDGSIAELIDDAPTVKWNGKYYREGIGEITEEEARKKL